MFSNTLSACKSASADTYRSKSDKEIVFAPMRKAIDLCNSCTSPNEVFMCISRDSSSSMITGSSCSHAEELVSLMEAY